MSKHITKRSYRHLNQADRDRLQALRDEGVKQKEIAKILSVDPGTISREIERNRRKYRKRKNIKNKNARYEAGVAEHKAYVRRKYATYQGKHINEHNALRNYIIKRLKLRWNPDEISGRMKKDHAPFYASKTAIYEWLRTVHGQRWCQYVYSQRYSVRKRKKKKTKKTLIPNRKGIVLRPLGATNRSRYGHYEGDTVVSAKKTASKAALSVLYERKAKYIAARKITNLKPQSNNHAIAAMQQNIMMKSITMDNGIENIKHEELGIPAYFCDPYSSWQKGGVENANKMIRRFIPKKSDINDYSDEYVKEVLDILNNKPRKSLHYQTPYEVMVEHNLFTKNKKIPSREIALRG
mgnify:CR=1 FL=1